MARNNKLKDKESIIISLNNEGKSVPEIAKILDVSTVALRKKLQSMGLSSNRVFKEVTGESINTIISLYKMYPDIPLVSALSVHTSYAVLKVIENSGFQINNIKNKNHSQKDKRFYTYIHKDINGNVVYIGSGSGKRLISKSGRSEEHKEVFDSLTKEVVEYGLSKEESLLKEQQLIIENKDNKLLFNKNMTPNSVKQILFEEMNKYFYYDESSPTFLRWKIDKHNRTHAIVRAGDIAGRFDNLGYGIVCLNNTNLRAHRVIFCLISGKDLPSNLVVDHIDRNPSNNNKNNLRLVSYSENNINRIGTSTEIRGISFNGHKYIVSWSDGLLMRTKTFSYKRKAGLIGMDLEEAKQKAFEDAVAFRKQMEELYYK